jgi:tetratricopeptide (TPR) repeat protein
LEDAESTAASAADASSPQQLEAEWSVAWDLKTKGDHAAAAEKFEAFANSHPQASRAAEAQVEAANSWINVGFQRRDHGRSNAAAQEAFSTALRHLDAVLARQDKAFAARAWYLRGNTKLYANDLAAAELEYSEVIRTYLSDQEWGRRALEKRSETRRHRLDTAGAIADLDLYLRTWPTQDAERTKFLQRTKAYTMALGKPAQPFASQDWVQGTPMPLEMLLGEVVALYFFSTQCSFCDAQRDTVAAWAKHLEGKVRFVGVLVPQQDKKSGAIVEPLDVARADVPKKRFDFPVVYDHGLRSAVSFMASKPDMVLLDREGRVRWHDSPKNLQPGTIAALLAE